MALALRFSDGVGPFAQPPDDGTAPPSAAGNPDRGKRIYLEGWAECNGKSGRGDGPAAHLLVPRPRDFALARYKIRSTESGSIPTDADLIRSVRKGLNGSAMPGWDGILAESDIRDVVAYIKSLSPRFASETPKEVPLFKGEARRLPMNGTASSLERGGVSPDSVRRGAAAYERLQCGKCHGTDGRGTGAVANTFVDDWGHSLAATDLTEPWTFHGGPT